MLQGLKVPVSQSGSRRRVQAGCGREMRHAAPCPHPGPLASGRGSKLQAACTNCICVPASSITSPFFRLTVSPTSGVLFTVGRAAPSTWAST